MVLWQKLEEEITESKKSQKFRLVPKYACDFFAKTGRKALDEKDWDKYCGKFSGSWKGWATIAKLYEEGKLQEAINKEKIGIL